MVDQVKKAVTVYADAQGNVISKKQFERLQAKTRAQAAAKAETAATAAARLAEENAKAAEKKAAAAAGIEDPDQATARVENAMKTATAQALGTTVPEPAPADKKTE